MRYLPGKSKASYWFIGGIKEKFFNRVVGSYVPNRCEHTVGCAMGTTATYLWKGGETQLEWIGALHFAIQSIIQRVPQALGETYT